MTLGDAAEPRESDCSYEVPSIYEHDYREVLTILDSLKAAFESHNEALKDAFVQRAEVVIESSNDYPIGVLTYEGEQWRFTPHADWAQDSGRPEGER